MLLNLVLLFLLLLEVLPVFINLVFYEVDLAIHALNLFLNPSKIILALLLVLGKLLLGEHQLTVPIA